MSDDTARFRVGHAQNERSRQAREPFEGTGPVAPAVKKLDRTVPGLRDRTPSEDEAGIVHQNVAKVRATLD